jgi:redox-regulated HSP33 family molecular chaperone|tara:strand:+ start:355 stop:672 length:318 start_codon:yes stop_codon:yes gene_type:complete
MLITRKSPVTGRINTLSIDVDQPQIDAWESGMLIQDAMPDLTADEREFIMTGSHENDWETLIGNWDHVADEFPTDPQITDLMDDLIGDMNLDKDIYDEHDDSTQT